MCTLAAKGEWSKNLRKRAKFIYLISPNKINSNFYNELKEVLKTNKVKFFQLRLKKISNNKIIKISRKIKKICKYFKVKFIINDSPLLALKVGADGCHLGQSDMDIEKARKIIKKKIIGVTCHNSLNKAKEAIAKKADYIAIGCILQQAQQKKQNIKQQ